MSKVAVLISIYNDPEGLRTALIPLCKASGDFDVIVVDDGSDSPLQIDYHAYPFPTVLRRLDRNMGIAVALNKGLEYILSKEYTYIARLDAWDRCEPARIVRQIAFLEIHPDHAIVGCDVDFVDWEGRSLYRYGPKLRHEEILNEMCYRPSFIHPAVMIRADALRQIGIYSQNFPGGEDFDLFLRLLRCYKGANIDAILLHVYLNPQGISLSQRNQLISTRLRLQLENFTFTNPHCYFGVLRTALLALIPYQLLYAIKRLLRPVDGTDSK